MSDDLPTSRQQGLNAAEWSSSRAWVAGVLVDSSSLSLGRVLCTSHDKEEDTESARNSTLMSDIAF